MTTDETTDPVETATMSGEPEDKDVEGHFYRGGQRDDHDDSGTSQAEPDDVEGHNSRCGGLTADPDFSHKPQASEGDKPDDVEGHGVKYGG